MILIFGSWESNVTDEKVMLFALVAQKQDRWKNVQQTAMLPMYIIVYQDHR